MRPLDEYGLDELVNGAQKLCLKFTCNVVRDKLGRSKAGWYRDISINGHNFSFKKESTKRGSKHIRIFSYSSQKPLQLASSGS